jgi:hypothetical protein
MVLWNMLDDGTQASSIYGGPLIYRVGLIVGLLNITGKEVGAFLIAAIAFMFTFTALGTVAEGIPAVGATIASFFKLVNVFVAPAAAVVAFKELFARAKN